NGSTRPACRRSTFFRISLSLVWAAVLSAHSGMRFKAPVTFLYSAYHLRLRSFFSWAPGVPLRTRFPFASTYRVIRILKRLAIEISLYTGGRESVQRQS